MPHSSIGQAAIEYSAHYKAAVIANTWGQLAPKPETSYSGWIIFCEAGYGGAVEIIDSEFKELNDSPWLYDDMYEYVVRYLERHRNKGKETSGVYVFKGSYYKHESGKYRFFGRIKKYSIKKMLEL